MFEPKPPDFSPSLNPLVIHPSLFSFLARDPRRCLILHGGNDYVARGPLFLRDHFALSARSIALALTPRPFFPLPPLDVAELVLLTVADFRRQLGLAGFSPADLADQPTTVSRLRDEVEDLRRIHD